MTKVKAADWTGFKNMRTERYQERERQIQRQRERGNENQREMETYKD